MTVLAITLTLLAVSALVAVVIGLSKRLGAAQEQAKHAETERERTERMAREMLKEKTREDVARDLDSGSF